MKFKKLKEKRLLLQSEMAKLISAADSENRALSDEESKRFDEIEKEIQDIDKTIAAEERARKLEVVDDKNTASDDKNIEQRAEEKAKAEERAFSNFIRGVVEDRAGETVESGTAATMKVTDNGAVIPQSIANKIIEKIVDVSPIFKDSEHYNVAGMLSIPYYDDSTGDITMEYCDEFTDGKSSSGQFKSISLNGFLARAITEVSKSLINNSQFNITNYVVNKMAQNIARFIEKELLFGTKDKVSGLSGVTQVVNAASAAAVTADEIIDLQEAVPDAYQANAYFIMNKSTRKFLRKLKDGDGNYLLNKDATSRWGYTLFGKDVYCSDNMPGMAAGKTAVYYGDYKGLAVKVSEDINIEILRETGARRHIIEVLGFVEFDAKVQNAQMIAALKMKTA